MRLAEATLDRLSRTVDPLGYQRAGQAVGIVHFGIGAFHRAHQAWYTDRAMASGDRDWSITGVSLRSPAVAERMNPQDGLYTVIERSTSGTRPSLVGSVREVLVAPLDEAWLGRRLSAATTRIVSLTITEKGYCRAPDGSLDVTLAASASVFRYLADAFRIRRAAGAAGVTLLSCDNLTGNSGVLRQLMREYLERLAPDLIGWFETECSCPSTMVDRIVPATTDADREDIAALIGLRDEAAVVTEPFSQWVIEDRFAAGRPGWDKVGAQIVSDVAPFETAKLRMLNGAHSALAYCGLDKGYSLVHEAIADPGLRALVNALMCEEAAPSIDAAPGQDLAGYAANLMARFENPALNHRLAQIAMDGSQKIPQRWLETLAERAARGARCPAILTALTAWLRHVRGDRRAVDDPIAEKLALTWREVGNGGIVSALFGELGLIPSRWHPDAWDDAFVKARLG